jgi:hypothetical protein
MRVLALCFVAILQSQVLAAPTQWSVSGGNNHFYEYVPTRLNWESARSAATGSIFLGQPGYLATITSAGENEFVRGLIADAAWAAWLGGSDIAAEGTWTWTDGPEAGVVFWSGGPVGYNNFAQFEPNNVNNEDAVSMWGPNGGNGASYWGQWNDFQASDTHGFVVEYAVPEPPLTGDYNRDGTVDAADYNIWRDSVGDLVTPGTGADANNNGFVENAEYFPWRDHFGESTSIGAGSSQFASSVPEPSTASLLLLLLISLGFTTSLPSGWRLTRADRR